MRNLAIFYTARKASTRLADKMLKKIQGKTVVELGLERLLFNKNLNIILCTTFLSEDNQLCDMARNLGVRCYRGPVDDVLERYLGAARQYDIEFFVAVDGDDLFIENLYIKKIVNRYKKTKADYIFCEGLPYGTYGTGVKAEALEKICRIKDDKKTEGWGRYFTKTKLFKTEKIEALKKHNHPEYRLTLDYEEDFKLIKSTYRDVYQLDKYFSLDEVFTFLKSHPQTARLNWSRKEEYAKRFKKKYSKIYLKNQKLCVCHKK